jgi:RimJ/RimL family protein N-acetyltransferase
MTLPEGYEIRAIKPDEVHQWWELRLQGLRDHPDAFGADYVASVERGPGHLEVSTRNDEINRIFGVVTEEGRIVSQAGVYRDGGKRRHIAHVWGVHTHFEWRGRGFSKALIRLAIDHCRTFPQIRQVHISVNATNAAALAVYEGAGFVAWGREPRALQTDTGFHDEIHMVMLLDEV